MPPASTPPPASTQDWWWLFDPRYSLRARAALYCSAGAALLVFVLGWVATASLRRSLEAHFGATFETLAVQVTDKIDRTIFERYRALRMTSSLAAMRRPETSPAERRQLLNLLQESAPELGWIGFIDANGQVVAATGGVREGDNVGQQPWFLSARDRPYIGGVRELPELARVVGNPDDPDATVRFFDLSMPVMGENGRFAGVLAAHVRWGWAREVQLSVVPEPALRSHMSVTIYAGPNDVLLDTGNTGWSQPPTAPAIPEAKRFRGTIIETTEGGPSYLTGYARSRGFKEYRGLGWFTTVRQPIDRVFAPVAQLKRSFIGWGLLLNVLAIAAGWALASRFAHQFRRMHTAATRIQDGDVLTVLPQSFDRSELARMCTSVRELVQHLRARHETLEKENAQLKSHARQEQPAKDS